MATSYSDRDMSLIPNITYTFVEEYIKSNKFSSGNKSIDKGFEFFSKGYIHDMKVHPTQDGCKVRGICHKSQRKTEDPYMIKAHMASVTGEPVVRHVNCDCPIGLNTSCGHITGLLYQTANFKILDLKALPEDIADIYATAMACSQRDENHWKVSTRPRGMLVFKDRTDRVQSTKDNQINTIYNPVRGEPTNWPDQYDKLSTEFYGIQATVHS